MPDDVPLTDLEVIGRWSLALRTASAPRDEVVAALRADLAWLTGDGLSAGVPAAEPAAGTPARPTGPVRRRRRTLPSDRG